MKTKNSALAGLGFGVLMGAFFIIQNLWQMPVVTASSVTKAVLVGLLAGMFSGLVFGWVISLMTTRFMRNNKIDFLEDGETIILETPANHFKGVEAVGGKLCLTNKRLIFQSHNFNVQNHRLIIDIHHLASAERYKSLGIVNNGLLVTSTEGVKEKFVVQSADKWMRELNVHFSAASLLQ